MKPQTMVNWGLAFIACVLIGMSHLLDGPPDMRAEWDQSEALLIAQREAAEAERVQRAAQAICNDMRGPHAEARWTEDGKLVCIGRRGVKPLQVAGGV
jgi:hypothetical protein